MVGANCNLAGSNLVEDVAVHANCVCGAGKDVHFLLCHYKGGHVVGYDGDVKAHVVTDGCGKACTLEIGSSFRTEEANVFASGFAFFEHHA